MKIAFSLFVVFFAAVWFFVSRHVPNTSDAAQPTPTPAAQAYLQPTLVIDSVISNAVDYHYEVLNTGKATASQIRYEEFGEGFSWIEPSPSQDIPRELEPGQTMQITLPPHELFPQSQSANFRRTLVLFYYTASSGTTARRFRFSPPHLGVLEPATLHFESSASFTEPGPEYFEGALSMEAGSVAMIFSETNESSVPLKLFLQSTNQFLQIDIEGRFAKFWSMTPTGMIERVKEIRINSRGIHDLAISWDGTNALLAVDGEEAEAQ